MWIVCLAFLTLRTFNACHIQKNYDFKQYVKLSGGLYSKERMACNLL